MKIQVIPLLLTALLVPICAPAQQAASEAKADHNSSKFVGVWRGQFDNLPGADLVVTNEGGELHGAILFYLHKRPDVNSPYTSTPGLPEPIFSISIDGNALLFQVSHRRAHPPRTLQDPPIKFRLKLTGPDQAELMNETEGAPGLPMKRTDY